MAKDTEAPSGDVKVDGGLVLKHKRRFTATKSKLDDIAAVRKDDFAAAENDGIHKAAFKLALRLNQMDPDEARTFFRLGGAYYEAMNPGVLAQKDLFAAVTPATPEERSESDYLEIQAAGRAAGRKGKVGQNDHPHDPGSAAAQAWERGWKEGDEAHFSGAGDAKATVVSAPRDPDAKPPQQVTPQLKKAGPKKAAASKKGSPKKATPAKKETRKAGAMVSKAERQARMRKPAATKPEGDAAPRDEVPEHNTDPSPEVPEINASAFDMGDDLTAH